MEARYGRRYYHFLYKNVLFLVLDTEDYSPARMQEIYKLRDDYLRAVDTDPAKAAKLPYASLMEAKVGEVSPEQSAYFEKVLAANRKARWTVLLMHKPVWNRPDDKGLGRIEAALKGRPYTLINGHLHRYSYTVRNGRDYIMLGTTGGGRAFDGSPGAMDPAGRGVRQDRPHPGGRRGALPRPRPAEVPGEMRLRDRPRSYPPR